MNFRQFLLLGEEIRSRLQRKHFDELALPEIAAQALAEAELDTDFSLDDLARFLLTTDIPQQPSLEFSNLPPIVYRCGDFRIELLVWFNATTSIHQHAFSGAFRVFSGSSVHSIYRFDERERLNPRLLIGDSSLEKVEILRTGDVRQIHSGRQGHFHSLFHLDRPSVTVVVRTFGEPWARPQYNLARPHIAYARSDLERDSRVRIISRMLDMTAAFDRGQAADMLAAHVAQLDFARLFMVLKMQYHLLDRERDRRRFLEVVTGAHGHLADHLAQLVRVAEREASIIATRNSVDDPELRFFLALLLNVPSREWIDRLVRDCYPSVPPEALYCRWLKRLADKESLADALQELAKQAQLGVYRFGARLGRMIPFPAEDPRTNAILEAVVKGPAADDATAGFEEIFQDGDALAAAVKARAQLLDMGELEPLLSGSAPRRADPG